jgi:hypothetical protein
VPSALLLVVALASSCPRRDGGAAVAAAGFDSITIHASPCFTCYGSCPVYSLAIHGDGRVRFEGYAHVHSAGAYDSEIPARNIGMIGDAIARARFFEAPETSARCQNSDGPRVRIGVVRGGQAKEIVYVPGCDAGSDGPAWLHDVTVYFAEAERWIDVTEPPRRSPGW